MLHSSALQPTPCIHRKWPSIDLPPFLDTFSLDLPFEPAEFPRKNHEEAPRPATSYSSHSVCKWPITTFVYLGTSALLQGGGVIGLLCWTGMARPPGACISEAETTSRELVLCQEPNHESKLKNVCLKVQTLIWGYGVWYAP